MQWSGRSLLELLQRDSGANAGVKLRECTASTAKGPFCSRKQIEDIETVRRIITRYFTALGRQESETTFRASSPLDATCPLAHSFTER